MRAGGPSHASRSRARSGRRSSAWSRAGGACRSRRSACTASRAGAWLRCGRWWTGRGRCGRWALAERVSITLRGVSERDWDAIALMADEAAPQATGGNRDWLRARMAFDESAGTRRHYVAVDDHGRVRGYGAVEDAARDGRYRVFIVTAPELLDTAGERML